MKYHSRESVAEIKHLPDGDWEGDEGREGGTEERGGSDERKYTLQSQPKDPNCNGPGRVF